MSNESNEMQNDPKLIKPFMSIDEACKYLDLKKNTLYSYTCKKVLPHYKLRGRKLYFKKEDLDNFIMNDDNRVQSNEEIEIKANEYILQN